MSDDINDRLEKQKRDFMYEQRVERDMPNEQLIFPMDHFVERRGIIRESVHKVDYDPLLPDIPFGTINSAHDANMRDEIIEDLRIQESTNFVKDVKYHWTRDENDPSSPASKDAPITYPGPNGEIGVFSGSTTQINPYGIVEKQEIIDHGLARYEQERLKTCEEESTHKNPPISPLAPFTRMGDITNPNIAQNINLTTYNRTKTPIADVAFRKGFRHIFFTRPECYIMSGVPNENKLSQQCENDPDMSSAYSREPHLLKMLSPVYVTGSFNENIVSNWNYLLSNNVLGMQESGTRMTVDETNSKTIEGYTINTPIHIDSGLGNTLDLSFSETKTLEIYEQMRLWMMYMYKRQKGVFTPSFNGYQYKNEFLKVTNESGIPLPKHGIYHPYDRALDYCCTLFDIVTNESDTKILYWAKYYGVYPTSATPNTLSNDSNSPLKNATTNVTFRYQRKVECRNTSLVEFNYNAGLTNDIGVVVDKKVKQSLPFLLKPNQQNLVRSKYIGAGGMFTGSPYIVMGTPSMDPLNADNPIVVPYLRFMPLESDLQNDYGNQGIQEAGLEVNEMIGTTPLRYSNYDNIDDQYLIDIYTGNKTATEQIQQLSNYASTQTGINPNVNTTTTTTPTTTTTSGGTNNEEVAIIDTTQGGGHR